MSFVLYSSLSPSNSLPLTMWRVRVTATIFVVVFALGANAVDFEQCLNTINNITIDGKTDNHGHPLPPSSSNATAITYDLCLSQCGSGSEPFDRSVFSEQLSAWVIPWLALISQLPFGMNDDLDNLNTVYLTLGSPTLAAYSLALTALNGRWIVDVFADYKYPNVREAVQALSSLQQSPLQINLDDARLASLIVLRQNQTFWKKLVEGLNYTQTWSKSAVANMLWVVVAYGFTVADYVLQDAQATLNTNGGSIGSLWLWLLPVVLGWLQLSPKCDSIQLIKAVNDANPLAFVATSDSLIPEKAGTKSEKHAISLRLSRNNDLRIDERSTAPIYNYARFLPWVYTVMVVSGMFHNAYERNRNHEPVSDTQWEDPCLEEDSQATAEQVESYCDSRQRPESEYTPWSPPPRLIGKWGLDKKAVSRMVMASSLALMLQWGTTGGAVVIVWFTPTVGLGCRSAAYIAYGVVSTLVWMMLLLSSILTYYATETADTSSIPYASNTIRLERRRRYRFAGSVSIFLRRFGKVLAALNAVWILVLGPIQFSGLFDRCFCNSSVFSLRKNAYNVIILTLDDAVNMRNSWIAGCCLAGLSTIFYIGYITLRANPRLPEARSESQT
ncbi:hypothetical protein GALMADRAFT_135575 [Galerina marginata CBS 339.88]|uniref:Uncharacterized protein n=1 Tax=Galerina marginata (strain CBS 339.88) TaxID=685588 RepID=A0A067TQK0_GALM3|nr:hypothetical protein GALMADRAFT_135575 [Galerina marginata CBS 339.88]